MEFSSVFISRSRAVGERVESVEKKENKEVRVIFKPYVFCNSIRCTHCEHVRCSTQGYNLGVNKNKVRH